MNIDAKLEKFLSDLAQLREQGINTDTNQKNLRSSFTAILESICQTEEQEDTRLSEAAIFVIQELPSISGTKLENYLNSILNSFKGYLREPENTLLPNEKELPVVQLESIEELGEYFCQEFMVDFVEQHSALLEEFETSVAGSDYLEASSIE